MNFIKTNQMEVLLYALLAGLCTVVGFFATFKLSQSLNRDKIYPMPDLLLLDCNVEFKLSNNFKENIISKTSSKISGNISDNIPLSPFFDLEGFKKDGIAKNNYSLFPEMYMYLHGMQVSALLDKGVMLNNNSEELLLTSENTKSPKIEIISMNKNTGVLKAKISNLQLDIETQRNYLLELKDKEFELYISLPDAIEPIKIEQAILKSKKTKYFILVDPQKTDLGFKGKLKSLV